MDIIYILLILLIITRAFGELAVRFRQPPLIGELIAGIVLGIIVKSYSDSFPRLAGLTENEVFTAITDLGIFFLMLLGGIEMRPKELAKTSGSSFLVAISAMCLPLFLGIGIAWYFFPESDYKFAQSLFAGTALAITAVPVAIRVLMDLGKLDSPIGRLIVSAAVFDDVLSLILLAVLTAIIKTGGLPQTGDVLMLIIQVVLFFVITILLGSFVLPWLGQKTKRFMLDELELSFLLMVSMGFAVLAEELHMHFILGAFIAGLFFGRRTIDEHVYDDVKRKVSGITTGFLAPFFFASIGFHLDLSAITGIPLFLFLLILIAVFSKLVGAAVPAYFTGYSKRDSMAAGVSMSARGAVELIVADIALRAGLFNHPDPPPPIIEHLFSAIVIVAVITTLVVPIALRAVLTQNEESSSSNSF